MSQSSVKLGVSLFILGSLLASAASLAVMSIDLGNEYMKIGIVKPGVPMEIVLNVESARKTSTVVAMRQNGDREFANAAMNTATRFPSLAYIYLRELLGKNTSNPVVQQFQQRFPYYKMEDDADRATINFEHPDGSKYSVEELLAMILESAKQYATAFAEQKVTDAVILCPAHFNQAERRALKRSAELAGIKVLQLMTNHAAVALNYGVFRRKEFNSTAQNYMFFDMGSTSTTVSIVSYQVVKMKVGSMVETNPQITVRGVGFDRSLGSLEITLRLRDHLAKVFNGQKKTSKDVKESPRAMAKLHKEAERVKKILSANIETFAQVENLFDDQDFKTKVTRDELESMAADIFEGIAGPVKQALASSEMAMSEINEVILMGGGTRAPKVKEMLQKAVKREDLGKSINTDEAAALGAVYQAAYLSTGFRVKTFAVKDANIYPIQVEFERKVEEDGVESTRTVKRTLFSRLNPFPQKKVMTFNKHTDDFNFNVNYGDVTFLSQSELAAFGSLNLTAVSLEGVKEQINKHVDNFTESKGVKAHFKLDESGLLDLDNVEIVFERIPDPAASESAFSKLSNTISSFFGSSNSGTEDSNSAEEKPEGSEAPGEEEEGVPGPAGESDSETKAKETEEFKESESAEKKVEEPQEGAEKTESDSKEESSEKTEDAAKEKDEKPKSDKVDTANTTSTNTTKSEPKPLTIKRPISSKVTLLDSKEPDSEHVKASKELLVGLTEKDEEKRKLAAVKNELESFSYDVKNKLYEEEYEAVSTEEEREEIREKLSAIIDWYEEQPLDTPLSEFQDKLSEAKKLVKGLFKRVAESKERPRAMEALKSTLNHTKYMLKSMKNFTAGILDEEGGGPFTAVELSTLETLYNESVEWMKLMKEQQKKKLPTDTPAYTVDEVVAKISALDREVKYLINKAKMWQPKKPKVTIKDSNSTKSNNTSKDSEASTSTSDGTASSDSETKSTSEENTIPSPDTETLGDSKVEEPGTQESSPPVNPSSEDIDNKKEEETLQLDSDSKKAEDEHIEL